MNEFNDPFSVCFNILKMRYKDYDDSLTSKNFLFPNDKVNVFINLETVFKHLSMIYDLEKKIMTYKDFEVLTISNILNLAAHYKRFIAANLPDHRIYIYHTDLCSESDRFHQSLYNEDFRSYYLMKFNHNPKFILLSEKLKESILPEVKTLCEFIPNLYYVSSNNIEGSLIPYVIAESDKSRKNLIIGGDLYDTQYSSIPNFVNHYINRTYNRNIILSDTKEYLKELFNNDENYLCNGGLDIFDNYNLYCTIISVIGDKQRSIEGISGYGPKTLKNNIDIAIGKNIIDGNINSPSLIGNIFDDDDDKQEFINNFYCTSVISMYEELTDAEKSSIINQQIDRSDNNTLESLNRTMFVDHPLILESLLYK